MKSLAVLALALLAAPSAHAEDAKPYTLTLKDHVFTPAEIKVPANTAFTLSVKNEDDSAEEFESEDLEIEKIIAGKTEATVNVPALEPGRYEFVGEFNEDTAKGVLIAE